MLQINCKRLECRCISHEMGPFFRNIYDYVARNLDTVEIMRDLLAGIYGMNVKGLPEADSPYGLRIAFTAVAVVLLWLLKRFNWR